MLPQAMHKRLASKTTLNTKATTIAERWSKYEGGKIMEVTIEDKNGNTSISSYSAVISTIPLPRLSMMDLTECSLSYGQWSAIRELRYGTSTKVSRA